MDEDNDRAFDGKTCLSLATTSAYALPFGLSWGRQIAPTVVHPVTPEDGDIVNEPRGGTKRGKMCHA